VKNYQQEAGFKGRIPFEKAWRELVALFQGKKLHHWGGKYVTKLCKEAEKFGLGGLNVSAEDISVNCGSLNSYIPIEKIIAHNALVDSFVCVTLAL
jgi:hypothetical protein